MEVPGPEIKSTLPLPELWQPRSLTRSPMVKSDAGDVHDTGHALRNTRRS